MNADEIPRLISEREAAGMLGVSVDTLQRLRQRRAISFRKIGGRIRYTACDLFDFIEVNKTPRRAPEPAADPIPRPRPASNCEDKDVELLRRYARPLRELVPKPSPAGRASPAATPPGRYQKRRSPMMAREP